MSLPGGWDLVPFCYETDCMAAVFLKFRCRVKAVIKRSYGSWGETEHGKKVGRDVVY